MTYLKYEWILYLCTISNGVYIFYHASHEIAVCQSHSKQLFYYVTFCYTEATGLARQQTSDAKLGGG
jgi:hypothetical protein